MLLLNALKLMNRPRPPRAALLLVFIAFLALFSGCVSTGPQPSCAARPFNFERDTFAYANDLTWEYGYDQSGNWVGRKRDPKPDYTLRCVSMSRAARQFFEHADFQLKAPIVDQPELRRRVRQLMRRDPGETGKPDIVIGGYSSLREFSLAHEPLLKAECGGAWRSYFQRGNWRMTLPFSRRHQARTMEDLKEDIARNCPPIIHAVSFPNLALNHSIVAFQVLDTGAGSILFCYDPNNPTTPIHLFYDARERRFYYPQTNYFPGGKINVYQIYIGPFI